MPTWLPPRRHHALAQGHLYCAPCEASSSSLSSTYPPAVLFSFPIMYLLSSSPLSFLRVFLLWLECRPHEGPDFCLLGLLRFPSTWVRTGWKHTVDVAYSIRWMRSSTVGLWERKHSISQYLPAMVLPGHLPKMLQPCQCDKSQLQMEQERPQQKKGKKQRSLKHKPWSPAYGQTSCLWRKSIAEALPELAFILFLTESILPVSVNFEL